MLSIDALPRARVREASNYPWEKTTGTGEGCCGLTQIEFDGRNMRYKTWINKGMEKIILFHPESV